MGILGLSATINSYIDTSVETEKLSSNNKLIVDGHGFVEQLATSTETPFQGTNYPPLNWINRGDRKQLAIYLYKYIKAFIDNGVHLTVVSSGPCIDENKFSSAFFKSMFKSLKFSKQFYREGTAIEPSQYKVKVLPKFNTVLSTEIFNILAQQYPGSITILRCPAESAPYIIDLAKKSDAIIVSNNADLLLTNENISLSRFNSITLKQKENVREDSFDISVKVAKRADAIQHLLSKWSLKSQAELNLCLALMKNDYTDEADVREFVGEDLYNFEKAAQFVREQVDKIEDQSNTDAVAASVISAAYSNNEKAIQNSKSAYESLQNPAADQLINLTDNDALAKAVLPEYIEKRNDSAVSNTFSEKYRSGEYPAPLVGLAHSFRNYEAIDLLSCATDTFSPSELWYPLKGKIIENVLLAEGSLLKVDPSYETYSFDSEFYGKLEQDSIEIKTSYQEKGVYLIGGSEKVHTFARAYDKYTGAEDRKRFIQLWIPENSDKTVEDYENALKDIAPAYQPYVLVFAYLYHVLQTKDPKPKADFLFLNEIIFASLFADKPVENASEVQQLAQTAGLSEELTKQNDFVNANYYRYCSYFEEGLSHYLMSSSALGWFGSSFNSLASLLLLNGSVSAHLRTKYNTEPTEETLLENIPEANRETYKQTREAIRSLCSKDVSQHFWVEDATDLLNTRSIFASNIPFNMKAADFYKLFENLKLKKVYLKSNETGTAHIGRGTLEFEDEESMKKALLFNRYRVEDRYLHLTPSVTTSAPKQEESWRGKTTSPTSTSTGPSDTQWRAQGPSVRGGKRGRGRGGASTRGASSSTRGSSTSSRGRGGSSGNRTGKRDEERSLAVDNVWDALQSMDE